MSIFHLSMNYYKKSYSNDERKMMRNIFYNNIETVGATAIKGILIYYNPHNYAKDYGQEVPI